MRKLVRPTLNDLEIVVVITPQHFLDTELIQPGMVPTNTPVAQ